MAQSVAHTRQVIEQKLHTLLEEIARDPLAFGAYVAVDTPENILGVYVKQWIFGTRALRSLITENMSRKCVEYLFHKELLHDLENFVSPDKVLLKKLMHEF